MLHRFGQESNFTVADADTLGGKGYGLARMTAQGLPVPPGVTIPTSACQEYRTAKTDSAKNYAISVIVGVFLKDELPLLEDHFGYTPLLSVRSGAKFSMPGMMDTILNLGLTPDTLPEWVERLGPRAALDCYRRFLQMYGTVVLGAPEVLFEDALQVVKDDYGLEDSPDSDLPAVAMRGVVDAYIALYDEAEAEIPTTLEEQLFQCIKAVFDSWDNPRAKHYRQMYDIPEDLGTAVNLQAMVFGNMDDNSCSGVLFTRDPNTGDEGITGEFLVNAQGEDVVAGIRTPFSLNTMAQWNPNILDKITMFAENMENLDRDMQDMEFTVQQGEVYILQTRRGKRSALATFVIANDMYLAGLINKEEFASRISAKDLAALSLKQISSDNKVPVSCTGLPAAGSVVSGYVALNSDEAVRMESEGDGPVILVTDETSPKDLPGMDAAVGILTRRGGMTSHAAVVARAMNKTCVVGADHLSALTPGSAVAINGQTGDVYYSHVEIVDQAEHPIVAHTLNILYDYLVTLPRNRVIPGQPITYIDAAIYEDSASLQAIMAKAIQHGSVVLNINPATECMPSEDLAFLSALGHKVNDPDLRVVASALAAFADGPKYKITLTGNPAYLKLLGVAVGDYVPPVDGPLIPVKLAEELLSGNLDTVTDQMAHNIQLFEGLSTVDLLMQLGKSLEAKNQPPAAPKKVEAFKYELEGMYNAMSPAALLQ